MQRSIHFSVLSIAALSLCAVAQNPNVTSGPETPVSAAPVAQSSTKLPPQAPASLPTTSGTIDGNDPLLQPPPLPKGNPTLIGGTVMKIDKVHESVTVKPFGGSNIKVYFDERTHIFRDGAETTMLGIHRGDRVYVDTLLDGSRVFAKNIRVDAGGRLADARGQVMQYNSKEGLLEIMDELSSRPVSFRVGKDTVIRHDQQGGSTIDLLPGSLVTIRFAPEVPGRGIAREVDITAKPGTNFTFAGKVTYLNMSRGVLALQNRTDDKSYEIHFNPSTETYQRLGVGDDVTVNATFDGQGYTAHSLSVSEAKK